MLIGVIDLSILISPLGEPGNQDFLAELLLL
jgi:hypothetical protein